MNVRRGGRKKRTTERKGGKREGREDKEESPLLPALAVLPGCTLKLTKRLVPGTGPGWAEGARAGEQDRKGQAALFTLQRQRLSEAYREQWFSRRELLSPPQPPEQGQQIRTQTPGVRCKAMSQNVEMSTSRGWTRPEAEPRTITARAQGSRESQGGWRRQGGGPDRGESGCPRREVHARTALLLPDKVRL